MESERHAAKVLARNAAAMHDSQPYVWLFDQRFDPLIPAFEQFLRGRGVKAPRPIKGYELFPDVVPPEDGSGIPELRQHAPEEVNRLFIAAWDAGAIPVETGSGVPVMSYSMEGLEPRPGLCLIGPDPVLVYALNDKVQQLRWLCEAGLPVPPFLTVTDLDELGQRLDQALSVHGAVFVQPAHSSGGEQAGVVTSHGDFAEYRRRAEERGFTESMSGFLVTRFLSNAASLSGHALITVGGEVLPLAVTELLQNGFRFDGVIFPTTFGDEVEAEILKITVDAGRILASRGYWGYCAVDFLYQAGAFLVITEINVRFAGEVAVIETCLDVTIFGLVAGTQATYSAPLVPPQHDRVVVTKIRPEPGKWYGGEVAEASMSAFFSGQADRFRVQFHGGPLHVRDGHFLGLAGRRFGGEEGREALYQWYLRAREPEEIPLVIQGRTGR